MKEEDESEAICVEYSQRSDLKAGLGVGTGRIKSYA